MDAVVSRFGLEAESPLRVGLDGPAGRLVLVLLCQGDLVATLLLHALGQAADGDLATNTEPGVGQNTACLAMWQLTALKLSFCNKFHNI